MSVLTLGLCGIGERSLWYDEGFTAVTTGSSWVEIVKVFVELDANMTSYHVLLRAWQLVLGNSEAALRSLSTVAVAGAVLGIIAVGRRLHGEVAGITSGLVLAVAPFAFQYSREARSYGLTMCLVVIASYYFVVMLDDDRRWAGAGYAVTGALACYSHLFAGLVLLAHVLSLVFLDPSRLLAWRRLAITWAGLGVLLLPLGLRVVTGSSDRINWIPAPRAIDFISVASDIAGGGSVTVALGLLVLVGAWQTARLGRRAGRSVALWRSMFGFTWLVVPYVVAFAVSLVVQPVFLSRYLIVCLPALALLAGVALATIRPRGLAYAAVAIVVATSAIKMSRLFDARSFQDWRGAVTLIDQLGTSADGVMICHPEARPAFEYYVTRLEPTRRPIPLSPPEPWETGVHEDAATPQQVAAWAQGPDRIWVVYRSLSDTVSCEAPTPPGDRRLALARTFEGVRVERYDR